MSAHVLAGLVGFAFGCVVGGLFVCALVSDLTSLSRSVEGE